MIRVKWQACRPTGPTRIRQPLFQLQRQLFHGTNGTGRPSVLFHSSRHRRIQPQQRRWNIFQLGRALETNTKNVPRNKAFVNAQEEGPIPHVILTDDIFPVKRYLLRPYQGKNLSEDHIIFNYRLPCARQIVENAFGILAARF